ncbi:four helix bundle protein [Patescibacteria group bacterium]|nr:four helix bundle protein [Patescibacteria group bacterium]MBU4512017.1 four helix bundle protein [Patescibacteria group bacterium]MCG2693206.1 four helix bundle protein [Candidatus Parcubacteria bacterium]
MSVKNFYELTAWQKARELTKDVYRNTKNFPKEELYGITSQSRRAIVSVCSNIAEGFGRFFYKDKKRFYYQARGSIQEVQSLLINSYDLEYISKETYIDLFKKGVSVLKLINGLIASVKLKLSPSDQ